MPISDSDPRVFFAAERTLLAWLRTGLTIIALGFVISRFGLFVHLLALQSPVSSSAPSSPLPAILGVAFVLAGTVAIIAAAIQHWHFIATLPSVDLPKSYSKTFALVLSFSIGVLGLALAGYLSAVQP